MKRCQNSWTILAMFFAALVLFCLGNIQGDPSMRVTPTHEYVLDHSPPVANAIIVTEDIISIQVERGVSVPDKGLIIGKNDCSLMYLNNNFSTGDVAVNLGLRSASTTYSSYNKETTCDKQRNTDKRGVNTRLDIGEYLLRI